jgi:hypothetical protein
MSGVARQSAGRWADAPLAETLSMTKTLVGDLFATFLVDHLPWMNVDYPFIGPWTLLLISSSNRNNDCLFNAMQLAKTIAKSAVGRAAYAKVNQSGVDLDVELSDGNGPELATSDNPHPDAEVEFADYAGDRGGSETQFVMNNAIWNGCGDGATEAQQKNTTLLMAVTILHETAHWKDDVKKENVSAAPIEVMNRAVLERSGQCHHRIFSSRCGELDDCPFANLDVDDTRRPLNRRPSPLANVFREPTRMRCTTSAAARISAPRGPQVQMFDTSGLVATFDVLVDAAGLWWHVLDIDGETGNLIEVNTVGDDPAPYQDSDMGCSAESQ